MKILLWVAITGFICLQCNAGEYSLNLNYDVYNSLDDSNSTDTSCPSWVDISDKALVFTENLSGLARRLTTIFNVFSDQTDCNSTTIYGCIVEKVYNYRNLLMSIVNRVELQTEVINDLKTLIVERMACNSTSS